MGSNSVFRLRFAVAFAAVLVLSGCPLINGQIVSSNAGADPSAEFAETLQPCGLILNPGDNPLMCLNQDSNVLCLINSATGNVMGCQALSGRSVNQVAEAIWLAAMGDGGEIADGDPPPVDPPVDPPEDPPHDGPPPADPCDPGATAFLDGSGSASNPYVICNQDQLKRIDEFPRGHFVLDRDITVSGTFAPLQPFEGSFDGNNHKISGLRLGGTALSPSAFGKRHSGSKTRNGCSNGVGMFSVLEDSAVVENLVLNAPELASSASSSTNPMTCVGSLAALNRGTIRSVDVRNASLTGITKYALGGLVGQNEGFISNVRVINGTVSNSASTSRSLASTYDLIIGGIAGVNLSENSGSLAEINESWSSMDITVRTDRSNNRVYVGGLVGWNNHGHITDSFTARGARIDSNWPGYYGGLVGFADGNASGVYRSRIRRSFTEEPSSDSHRVRIVAKGRMGGLVGHLRDGLIEHSFSHSEVSCVSNSNSFSNRVGGIAGGIAEAVNLSAIVSMTYTQNRSLCSGVHGLIGYVDSTATSAATYGKMIFMRDSTYDSRLTYGQVSNAFGAALSENLGFTRSYIRVGNGSLAYGVNFDRTHWKIGRSSLQHFPRLIGSPAPSIDTLSSGATSSTTSSTPTVTLPTPLPPPGGFGW